MIETDEQRRWWFANHPEYSWSHKGGNDHREQDDNGEGDKVRPEEVDAYVDRMLKYAHGPVAELLKSVKRNFGTEGETKGGQEAELIAGWDTKARAGAETDHDEGRAVASSHEDPFTYDQGCKDGMKWALDPNRGPGPPRVLNPEYLNGFSDGVTEVWKQAQARTETWNRLSQAASDTWDTLTSWLPLVGGGILGRNMEKLGQRKPPDHAEHHIVPQNDRRFPEAIECRELLDKFDIPIHHPANGAFLPNKPGVGPGAYHPSVHTREYYQRLLTGLRKARTQDDAIRILQGTGRGLSEGKFPN